MSKMKQFARDLTARAIAPILRRLAHDPKYFELWQSYGFHVTAVHYDEPIPDTRALPLSLWNRVNDLPGLDMREEQQRQLLSQIVAKFKEEYSGIPTGASTQKFHYYLENAAFEAVDAEMLFGLIRLLKPRRIYEIGSGFSTLLAGDALRRNRIDGNSCRFVAIDRTLLRNCKLSFLPTLSCCACLFRSFHSMSLNRLAKTTSSSLTPRMNVESAAT
jgi:hypothetical protein